MITAAILTGGNSDRMGQDKALMPFLGRPLILRVLDRISPIAGEVILSTNRPEEYAFLDLPLYPDLQPGHGALGGLYTALKAAKYPFVAAVACDMPFVNPGLFEFELDVLSKTDADVAIPSTPEGMEPLHAVYRRETCLAVVKSALDAGRLKLVGWLPEVNIRIVPPEETAQFDPQGLAFWNLNTPEEFRQAEERARLEKN